MPQTIALASTCFPCSAFENLIEMCMRVVLAVPVQDLRLPLADRCLVDQTRMLRILEKSFGSELR
jgi:hypothetical protein